ncbi:MAG: hypothetical protein HOO06_13505 [Bdellovibrionaceae bacterium]|jgi:fructose-bisphosphate aldolase, class I|nr:hypothetical protein [Pseudobdellovibrionaceae bacterium]
MKPRIREILTWYNSEPPIIAAKLADLLNRGQVAGTGKFGVLALDELSQLGVHNSLLDNLKSLQPGYAFELAIRSGVNALVAPLKNLEVSARDFSGDILLFAQISLDCPQQVERAFDLGAIGVSVNLNDFADLPMISEVKEMAQSLGLLFRVHVCGEEDQWSFEELSQLAFELAQVGAHLISFPLPGTLFINEDTKAKFHQLCVHLKKIQDQVKYIREAAVEGQLLISFYGLESRLKDVPQVVSGGALGYDFGHSYFQMTMDAATDKIEQIFKLYVGKI